MSNYTSIAEDVAREWRVKPATVRLWVKQGKIPAKKLGRKLLRFDLNEVRAALESNAK